VQLDNARALDHQTPYMTSLSTSNALATAQAKTNAPIVNELDSGPSMRAHVCDVLVDYDDLLNDVSDNDDVNIKTKFDSNEVISLQDRNELQYVKVCIMDDDCNKCEVNSLVDSGTEVSVANSEAINQVARTIQNRNY
jgi:hypothetical protein